MAHKCPRCGDPVQRGYSNTALVTAGLIGALFYAAFGAFECKKCGKIARNEFPEEVRIKMAGVSLLLVLGAIVAAIGVFWLLSAM
jgi:hypothetical protein